MLPTPAAGSSWVRWSPLAQMTLRLFQPFCPLFHDGSQALGGGIDALLVAEHSTGTYEFLIAGEL